MEIPENMEQWNILGKMEKWDTSTTLKEIEKDLIPYLDYVDDRLTAHDNSIANELDTLKKILPRVRSLSENFLSALFRPLGDARELMEELFLLPGHTNCKLKTVLMDQTELKDHQKDAILRVWEKKSKYHWGCMPLDDSTPMEEFIRTNSAIISNISDPPEGVEQIGQFQALVSRTGTIIISFHKHTCHPDFKKDTGASSSLQVKRCNSTEVKMCKSTKHKRLKSTSSPKADTRASSTLQLKRCNSTEVKRCKSTKHKRLKSTSSLKASEQ